MDYSDGCEDHFQSDCKVVVVNLMQCWKVDERPRCLLISSIFTQWVVLSI